MTKEIVDPFIGKDNENLINSVMPLDVSDLDAAVKQKINFDSRLQEELQARLNIEVKLLQLQIEFADFTKLSGQVASDISPLEQAKKLADEAASLREISQETAYLEAKRKLKAEQEETELMMSQAEADRKAWHLKEQTNVLLRKAEKKAQERLITEKMARKAAEFKLQTERELAELAEQQAELELQAAREVEVKLRSIG